jgi:hypothetical protein
MDDFCGIEVQKYNWPNRQAFNALCFPLTGKQFGPIRRDQRLVIQPVSRDGSPFKKSEP